MTHVNSFKVLAPSSKFYQGPFGRICGDLPAWSPPGLDPVKDEQTIISKFLEFAREEMIEEPGLSPTDIAKDNKKISELECKFSSDIPAAYTYFGQFVDHDITFDPASSLMRKNDPSGLLNHRTPRLDLDNIYGKGRGQSPYLYDDTDNDLMLIGNIKGTGLRDLPRNSQGRALIGDMRNDENSMVSQIQLAFLLAHNELVRRAREQKLSNPFEAAQNSLRNLYQYIVWKDFLPRITDDEVHGLALSLDDLGAGRSGWTLGFDDVYQWKKQPFMPIEFSVAAYRFGHSMVRNSYQTNQPHRGFNQFAPIFDNSGTKNPDDLRGFREMTAKNTIQWDWFLEMNSSGGPFPQRARKIDTKLSNALASLAEHPDSESPQNVLAFRNLVRGLQFDLPSGSDVARKFCFPVIDIDPNNDSLWFYILKEAEIDEGNEEGGHSLGKVGSTIVCATFAGLLKGDPTSWINQDPCWTPDEDPLLSKKDKIDSDDWSLASIIRLSGLPVSGGDVVDQTASVDDNECKALNLRLDEKVTGDSHPSVERRRCREKGGRWKTRKQERKAKRKG